MHFANVDVGGQSKECEWRGGEGGVLYPEYTTVYAVNNI